MDHSISYALHERLFYLRMQGELRYTQCNALDLLIEQVFAEHDTQSAPLQGVVIDLSGASFMDSTIIGLLASIARGLQSRGLPRATVFVVDPEIRQLLTCLCLDQVFTLVTQTTAETLDPDALLALDPDTAAEASASESQTGAIILKAHEALIGINEANRPVFQPVVDLFREQLERS
jgi:anti-anti-sigma factor